MGTFTNPRILEMFLLTLLLSAVVGSALRTLPNLQRLHQLYALHDQLELILGTSGPSPELLDLAERNLFQTQVTAEQVSLFRAELALAQIREDGDDRSDADRSGDDLTWEEFAEFNDQLEWQVIAAQDFINRVRVVEGVHA